MGVEDLLEATGGPWLLGEFETLKPPQDCVSVLLIRSRTSPTCHFLQACRTRGMQHSVDVMLLLRSKVDAALIMAVHNADEQYIS